MMSSFRPMLRHQIQSEIFVGGFLQGLPQLEPAAPDIAAPARLSKNDPLSNAPRFGFSILGLVCTGGHVAGGVGGVVAKVCQSAFECLSERRSNCRAVSGRDRRQTRVRAQRDAAALDDSRKITMLVSIRWVDGHRLDDLRIFRPFRSSS